MPWGSGVANKSKQIRAVQISRTRHWNQLAMPDSSSNSSSGSEGDQERQLEARCFLIVWSVSTKADCRGQLQSFKRRFLDELVHGQHEALER